MFNASEYLEARDKKNTAFKYGSMPLSFEQKYTFQGLMYWTPDEAFVISAAYEELQNKVKDDTWGFFIGITTTSFGVLRVYDFNDKLTVPFRDLTNGKESYGAGRYMDVDSPENDRIILDFNLAYNPWCAYSVKYMCAIIPYVNSVDFEIKAGEKIPLGDWVIKH